MEEETEANSTDNVEKYLADIVADAAREATVETASPSSPTAPADVPVAATAPNVWQQKKFRRETASWRERKLY